MKPRKIQKLLLKGFALGMCLSPWTVTYAAQQEMLWGNVGDYAPLLKNFNLVQATSVPHGLRLPVDISTRKNNANTFRFANGTLDNKHQSHVRYDQYYQGVPVWGTQVIYHISKNNTSITGSMMNGIDKDITNLNGKISVDQIKSIAVGKNNVKTPVTAEKIIYQDDSISKNALLAWHVSYLNQTHEGPTMPSYIIDANSGKVLKEWDALPTVEQGIGLGGTMNRKEYQFGTQTTPGMNALGNIDVTYATSSICTLSNNTFRVYNLKNVTEASLNQAGGSLPVSTAYENSLAPFAYYCSGSNKNDNGYGGLASNGGISPINDATYFVKQTMYMLNDYGVPAPVGSQLPVRVYTHVAEFDNAFACDSLCMRGMGIAGPQQLVFGNGVSQAGGLFAPLTEGDVVAHEFGHLVTANFSKLIYVDQSGGMNEAFSDMTGVAMNNYMRVNRGFTWYWDGVDFTTGKSITKSGLPLRYFDEPTKDRVSISNAINFRAGMNPHLSSGVYNKAFYLLSTTPGWSVDKAYRVMLDANMYYWTFNSQYVSGACGVVQAAANRGYAIQDVKKAFLGVGIGTSSCGVLKS